MPVKEQHGQAPQPLREKPMIVVDLFSGSYIENEIGHEYKNLESASDGRYYGYCPPLDRIDIKNLGASKHDDTVSGVIVVYVRKRNNSSDRTIVAFSDNATVHRHSVDDVKQLKKLGRVIKENGRNIYLTYSIESDYLVRLGTSYPEFTIHLSDYNTHMFRAQRFFKGKYPVLDKQIYSYLERCKNYLIDDLLYQAKYKIVALINEI